MSQQSRVKTDSVIFSEKKYGVNVIEFEPSASGSASAKDWVAALKGVTLYHSVVNPYFLGCPGSARNELLPAEPLQPSK